MKVANNIVAEQTHGKQFKTTTSEIELAEVKKKFTKSMDDRLQAVIEKKGHYIKMWRIQRLMYLLFVLL